MQSITSKDGTRKRAFCLSCLKQGREWVGGELCEHFQNIEAVAPTAQLDQPSQANAEPKPSASAPVDAE